MLSRSAFLRFLGTAAAMRPSDLAAAQAPAAFVPWRPGLLDIHHISTGRGNCTLILCPDGTTMMVDAGATQGGLDFTIAPIPDDTRRPGEWIARYARRHLRAAQREEIDYFVLTHLHGDHMGEVAIDLPKSKAGNYKLTGITDVAETLPVRRILDRGYPEYDYPTKQNNPSAMNYIEFVRAKKQQGAIAERFQAGSGSQIRLLRKPADYPGFSVRNLAVNGEVWTGVGDTTRHQFPALDTLKPAEYPTENMCCLALRLSYGAFDYYTGGDLPCGNNDAAQPWRDIESPVARATGPVEVAIMNHHGYVDSIGADYVRSLRPRAFILMAWDSAHPGISTLARMMSTSLYPGKREIYATTLKAENKIVNKRLNDIASSNGHIVVRVAEGGKEFQVVILENKDESDRVKATFGPFLCG